MSATVFVTARSVIARTVTEAAAVLLAGLVSATVPVITAPVDNTVPGSVAVGTDTVITSCALAALGNVGAVHATAPPWPRAGARHTQPDGLAKPSNVVPTGSVCVSVTGASSLGPLLRAVVVMARLVPALIGLGAAMVMAARSSAWVTLAAAVALLFLRLASVVVPDTVAVALNNAPAGVPASTVTARAKVPLAPAATVVRVQLTVPLAPVIGVVQSQPAGAASRWNAVPAGTSSVKTAS